VREGSSLGVRVHTAGTALLWVLTSFGLLGDGTNSDSNVPVVVSRRRHHHRSHAFASVRAGHLHSCGVTTAGAAYCWGFNLYGQLGNGTNTNSKVPVPVSPP
jgi:alpha-tubulin suppressor-like RCC1 family protein